MIRKALLLFPVLALAPFAHAQFSAYATVSLEHMTGINSSPILQTLSPPPCTAAVTTGCTSYNHQVDPLGATFGASYDVRHFGPALLTADARAVIESSSQGAQSNARGSGTHIYSYLGGLKASFHTPLDILRPYVQGSVGYARSNYGVLTNARVTSSNSTIFPAYSTQNNLEYHVYAGADLRFLPVADWRVIEVGYGAIQAFGNYSHSYPLYSLSTGVVFHFPPRP